MGRLLCLRMSRLLNMPPFCVMENLAFYSRRKYYLYRGYAHTAVKIENFSVQDILESGLVTY